MVPNDLAPVVNRWVGIVSVVSFIELVNIVTPGLGRLGQAEAHGQGQDNEDHDTRRAAGVAKTGGTVG